MLHESETEPDIRDTLRLWMDNQSRIEDAEQQIERIQKDNKERRTKGETLAIALRDLAFPKEEKGVRHFNLTGRAKLITVTRSGESCFINEAPITAA